MTELLKVENLSAGYGEAVVLHGVSVSINEGETLALLGRNGTGKTTFMNTLAGATRQHGGTIHLGGAVLHKLPQHERAAAGIGFEIPLRASRRHTDVAARAAGDPYVVDMTSPPARTMTPMRMPVASAARRADSTVLSPSSTMPLAGSKVTRAAAFFIAVAVVEGSTAMAALCGSSVGVHPVGTSVPNSYYPLLAQGCQAENTGLDNLTTLAHK